MPELRGALMVVSVWGEGTSRCHCTGGTRRGINVITVKLDPKLILCEVLLLPRFVPGQDNSVHVETSVKQNR